MSSTPLLRALERAGIPRDERESVARSLLAAVATRGVHAVSSGLGEATLFAGMEPNASAGGRRTMRLNLSWLLSYLLSTILKPLVDRWLAEGNTLPATFYWQIGRMKGRVLVDEVPLP